MASGLVSALAFARSALPPPGSTHSPTQPHARYGVDRSWKKTATDSPDLGAAQPPQLGQSRHPNPQPTPHHSLALNLGGMQHRKGHDFGLLLGKPQPPTQAVRRPHLLQQSPRGVHSRQWSLPGPEPEGF